MPETFQCENCGNEHPLSERREFENHFYCTRCFPEVTLVCTHCGKLVEAFMAELAEDQTLVNRLKKRARDRLTGQ